MRAASNLLRGRLVSVVAASIALCMGAGGAVAQGILTVTPTRSASTTAGTGSVGYAGDGGGATSATLATPGAVAYDRNNNLFVADTNNHVVREITPAGVITTVAGNGTEGFSGDGGAATSAQLDTPTGVAVDGSGNLYIADSHNQRIRKVSGGTISTVAGTGVAGFSGDGGAATSAQLALPTGIAVDAAGSLYIADTNNHRVREVANGTITTIAGDGEEFFAGDGGVATAAALDSPTGVAVSSDGTVYVADRLNQRIRAFKVGGSIATVAGSGGAGFSGSFAGDGGSATAAMLARPTGVSVDANGNIYVADTDNHRVRQFVSGGAIATVTGTGEQGFSGDGGAATSAVLNAPRSVGADAAGNLAVADTLNQRIRAGQLPTITFSSDGVGIVGASQSITLTNSGTASLTVGSITLQGAFTTTAGGSCSALPITLAAGASCTQNLAFLPVTTGTATGSVVVGGGNSVPQTVLLAGTGTQSSTMTTLTTNIPTALTGQTVTFTATVQPQGIGSPSGTVSFYFGTTLLGTVPVAGSSASLSISSLLTGADPISAVYSGDGNFTMSNSASLTQLVEDFSLSIQGATVVTVVPGRSGVFTGTLQSLDGLFSFPIALSLTGLPAGATATFNPATITLGTNNAATTTLTVQTADTAANHMPSIFGGGGVVAALLLLPFSSSRRLRQRVRGTRLLLSVALLLSLGGLTALMGCGTGSGLLGQAPKTYTINLIGAATGANGYVLQRTTSVTVTVE